MQQEVDVAVIGAGPAGLAAAIKAKEAGAENVVVLERAESLGGLLDQCVHNGFGLLYFGEDLSGPEYRDRFIEKAMDLKVDAEVESMILELSKKREIKVASNKKGYFSLKPKSIVLAMGCRERTRFNIGIPGSRPTGIYTAGQAQRFVNMEGFIPGKKIIILGSGDIGMIMARRLTLEGAKVGAVVEILPYIGGLIRNEVQCVHDFDIPLFLRHTVSNIHGFPRIEGVTISAVDENINPIPGTQREIDCDTLLLSVGLIPENELSLMAGVELDPLVGGAIVDEARQTSVPGIFAGGNVVHVHDLVDNVSWESEIAGASAAAYAKGEKMPSRKIEVTPGKNIRYIVPQFISGEKDVTFYMRVKEPDELVRVKMDDIVIRKSEMAVKPSSMLKIDVPASILRNIKKRKATVDCVRIKEK
ncbi:MAG: FAD-dependent oxidoreductase [Thermodesulfobacteriota bacterium]|nr:FAD-dependent oxidoreductase [Thermodesulfobacteriota bacterium]